jgi:L-fuculose-phosphate aldolase
MQAVFFHVLNVHGLKRPQADVQGDLSDRDAALADTGQELRGEVQARRRSGDAASRIRPGIDRLVALAVFRPVCTRDVRRQRYVPQLFHCGKKVRHRRKTQGALAKLPAPDHLGHQFRRLRACGRVFGGRRAFRRSKENLLSHADLPSRTHQRLPLQGRELAGQQDFHAAAQEIPCCRISGAHGLGAQAGACPEEARGKDAAIVHHQQVVGAKQRGKIGEAPVFKFPIRESSIRAPEMEQARGAAVGQGFLGDQLLGQVKIKVGNQHQLDYIGRHPAPGEGRRLPPGAVTGETRLSREERELRLREEICRIGHMLHQCGFVAGCDGNISVRLERNLVLGTPTSISKGMMEPGDLVLVDMEGRQNGGSRSPSTELGMHLLYYQYRPDIRAVVHAHPPTATGFAAAGVALDEPLVAEVVVTFGSIPLARYGTPGTPELAAELGPLMPGHDAILMANHGVVTCGHDLLNAYMKMEKVEHYARIVVVARQLGPIQPLTDEQVRKLMKARLSYEGNRAPALPELE